METNKLVWVLGIGAAGYLLYNYGVQQGWWSSLTGPSVATSVLSAAQQQAFIASATAQGVTAAQIQTAFNQLATAAAACGVNWNPTTGSCGATTSAPVVPTTPVSTAVPVAVGTGTPTALPNPGSTLPPAGIVNPGSTGGTSPSSGVTAAQLIAASGKGTGGTLTPDQWNYYEAQINPAATVTDFSAQGWTRDTTAQQNLVPPGGGSNLMTAAQYIALRQTAGLSGLFGFAGLFDPTGYDNVVPNPFGLVTDEYDDGYAGLMVQ